MYGVDPRNLCTETMYPLHRAFSLTRPSSIHHHLLVGNTNMAPFSLVYDTNMAAFSLVYDTNMATVTSLETLYRLVIVSLDCMLVPVRCGKKYIEKC